MLCDLYVYECSLIYYSFVRHTYAGNLYRSDNIYTCVKKTTTKPHRGTYMCIRDDFPEFYQFFESIRKNTGQ
jgi:hypothetical protein